MDQAVKMDPQNPAPRFIRAMNNFHLPAIINRRDNARADFEVLLKQIEDPHTSYRLRVQTREVIYYLPGCHSSNWDARKKPSPPGKRAAP
jgi:hypothetical protein